MKKSVGVSFTWTSQSLEPDGSRRSYAQAVDHFDAERFAEELKGVGAQHVIFTLTHAEQYLAFPCCALDRIMPGRTTERDLLGEILQALDRKNIRFIAYYNHSCNGDDDIPWKEACGYSAGKAGNLDGFAENICGIVEEIAGRYKELISAWWFDSPYSVDTRGPHNTVSCDIGDWNMPWEKLVRAARNGNRDAAVSINAGVGQNYLYYPEDYYSGETVQLQETFTEEMPGIIGHRWICIDNPAWVYTASGPLEQCFSEPRFSDTEILEFIRQNQRADRMTTFNMEMTQSGLINPAALEQFARVRRFLDENPAY